MRVIHVLRKPLSEGTVAANVLEHGTGAINVDASRVSAPGETISNHSRGDDSAISKGIYGDSKGQETHQTAGQAKGRWPGNLILEHNPECQCVGVTQQKVSNPIGKRGGVPGRHVYKTGHKGRGSAFDYTDADGKETVAAWECAPSCPVAALDEQSGGASRFFKQVGGKKP